MGHFFTPYKNRNIFATKNANLILSIISGRSNWVASKYMNIFLVFCFLGQNKSYYISILVNILFDFSDGTKFTPHLPPGQQASIVERWIFSVLFYTWSWVPLLKLIFTYQILILKFCQNILLRWVVYFGKV